MSTTTLALLCVLIAYASAQTKPVWPSAASTSVLVHGWGRSGERHFMRYFYDSSVGKERIDGPRRFFDEDYWTTVIIDTKTHQETFIAYQRDLVTCVTGPTNVTLPKPNFNGARFVGQSLIDYVVVNNWIERLPDGRDGMVIFSDASNGEILRLDFHDPRRGHAVEFRFMEFDAGNQDPSLWVVPAAISAICSKRSDIDYVF